MVVGWQKFCGYSSLWGSMVLYRGYNSPQTQKVEGVDIPTLFLDKLVFRIEITPVLWVFSPIKQQFTFTPGDAVCMKLLSALQVRESRVAVEHKFLCEVTL